MDKTEDGTVSYKGYCIDLINELARNLHFTYDLYLVPDGKYGALTDNGTWNGMVGELVRQVSVEGRVQSLALFIVGQKL